MRFKKEFGSQQKLTVFTANIKQSQLLCSKILIDEKFRINLNLSLVLYAKFALQYWQLKKMENILAVS
jgi:hypothetical protein